MKKVKMDQSCLTLCDPMDCRIPGCGSPGKNTGVGCNALLQGIFPTQESNPSLLQCPALAGGFFTTNITWELPYLSKMLLKFMFLKIMVKYILLTLEQHKFELHGSTYM